MSTTGNAIKATTNKLILIRDPLEGQISVPQETFLGTMITAEAINDLGAQMVFSAFPASAENTPNPKKLAIHFGYTSPGCKNFGSAIVLSLSELLEVTAFLNGVVQKELEERSKNLSENASEENL